MSSSSVHEVDAEYFGGSLQTGYFAMYLLVLFLHIERNASVLKHNA